MPQRIIKEKQSNVNVPGLIIAIILFVALCVGGFFVIGRCSRNNQPKEDETSENTSEVEYNRLLKVLNDNVNTTKVEGEKEATAIVSFSFKESHFYISGVNEDILYYYDVDLNSQTLENTKEAYDFVIKNEIEGHYDILLDRYSFTASSEFANKFTGAGKAYVGELGPLTKVFMTQMEGDYIYVINGDSLEDTLKDEYTPTIISNQDSLYPIYEYIANK